MENKDFIITRVVTRNFITDSFQWVRNLFGLRLRKYEDIIIKSHAEVIEEMKLRYKDVAWYRISFNPLVDGSIMINLYGELK